MYVLALLPDWRFGATAIPSANAAEDVRADGWVAGMTDFPPGQYSHLLVGHVWPSGANVVVVEGASAHFGNAAAAYHHAADQLRAARFGPLGDQHGVTADDTRETFQRGENHARNVAEKNETKKAAFDSAHNAVSELRRELTTIAREGDNQIRQVLDRDDPLAARVDRVAGVVVDCQTRATAKAATYGEDVLNSIQKVLETEGSGQSARQFAAAYGVDTGRMFASPTKATAVGQVAALLDGSPAVAPGSNAPIEAAGAAGPSSAPSGASLDTPPTTASLGEPATAPQHPPTPTVVEADAATTTLPSTPDAPMFSTAQVPAAAARAKSAGAPAPKTAAPPPRAGPVLARGAESRPPTTSATAAAPASLPTRAGGTGPPALKRAARTPAPHKPAGITEQAVAGTDRAGLQQLVNTVARQEPRLAWAAGTHRDGSTVLVTDLCSGWIPPEVAVPRSVGTRRPACRRGDLEALLGDVTASASYVPARHRVPGGDIEPPPVRAQTRQGPVVDELGWQLVEATKWRDGLPRLAYTLAKAASAGTGVLDSEIDLLRGYLDEAREQILAAYPDHHEAAVGNWQLLAATDALVRAQPVTASYHFAWFAVLGDAAK
jgi:hypothetical protein